MAKQKLLIIAHTPYHIILAHAIARQHEEEFEADIIIVGDFSESGLLTECLQGGENPAFSNIFHLPGNYGLPQPSDEVFVRQKNVDFLKKHLADNKIDKLITFNDNQAESQAAYFFASRNNPDIIWASGEDGGGFYGKIRNEELSQDSIDWYRRFYGLWWNPAVIFGENPAITELWAVFPDLVRPELQAKKIHAISLKYVLELRNTHWPLSFFEKIGGSLDAVKKTNSLVFLPHSDFIKHNPGYTLSAEACVTILKLSGHRFAYKLHPREYENADIPIPDENPIIIPKAFPAELLFLIISDPLRCIIGDQTTSLMTARWLSDTTKAYSLATMLSKWDERLIENFTHVGIIKLTDFADLRESLTAQDEEIHISTLYYLLSRLNNGYSKQLFEQSSQIQGLESDLTETGVKLSAVEEEFAWTRNALKTTQETLAACSSERDRIEKEYQSLYNGRPLRMTRFMKNIIRKLLLR